MGTPEYAAVILEGLICSETVEIVAVVTQPDRPVGRKQVLTPPPVKGVALAAGLPLYQPQRLDACFESLQELRADLIIVAAYGQILSQRVLDLAPCYNLHASLLPAHRGAAPIQASLLGGDRLTGMTLMAMEAGLDTGPMVAFNLIPTINHDAASLSKALQRSGASLLIAAIKRLDRLRFLPQHGCDANLVRKVKKSHALIGFTHDAKSILRAFLAYTPWPGIHLSSGLTLLQLSIAQPAGRFEPGAILSISPQGVEVGTPLGSLLVKTVQAPSKKPISTVEYLNGKRLGLGDILV